MKIISVCAIKGGVGKTMIVYNMAKHLAYNNKKVLLFDFDHQCNLSQVFDNDEQYSTVRGIFTGEDVEIKSVSDNIDLVSGYYFLDEVEEELEAGREKYLYLYQWFGDNYSSILTNYDYIIIDTHPDFRAATRNAVVVSDIIISPDVPGANNQESLANLTVRFNNFQEKEHLLEGKLWFVGNRIKHNTKRSRNFKSLIESEEKYITYFEEKELFIEAAEKRTSVDELMENPVYKLNPSHKKYYENYKKTMNTIINR